MNASGQEKSVPTGEVRGEWWQRGRDIWVRARTNALAHKIAAENLQRIAQTSFLLRMTLVVIPIVCIGISLSLVTAGTEPTGPSVPSVAPPTSAQTALPSFLGLNYKVLSLIAIISNGLALFIGIISNDYKWSERSLQHRSLLSSYSIIAQKARRLESVELDQDEGRNLYSQLQDMFEIYKSHPYEPSHKSFSKAQEHLLHLQPFPFGLTAEELTKKISREK
jgi:hypothetical protein